jgi:hypothetical protein
VGLKRLAGYFFHDPIAEEWPTMQQLSQLLPIDNQWTKS